ncbi:hypothetical protein GCM10022631_24620 [Deinococcus rubellus]|uniref:hypothetical protein n=1 Tax=Deinococcus rubellus TaxID=1889240 RepID=UPI003389203F
MQVCFVSHFPEYRKNQVDLLALLVLALIQAKDVRHAALAERCCGNTQTASVIRRIERFFEGHPVCPLDVARLVLALLPDSKRREFIVDRTNWKLGLTDVNALVLAVNWRGVAVPLLFELLPHGGSSDTDTRLILLDQALTLLDCCDVATLYGDREFIGQSELRVWLPGDCRSPQQLTLQDFPALGGRKGVLSSKRCVQNASIPQRIASLSTLRPILT